ncbi:Protein transport protein Sec16A, partial [Serendipita sp. 405]
SDASSFFYNSLGIEDDPTPTIANSVPATDYIGGSKEADYKASEPNNSFFSNESHGETRNDVQPGAPEDPYAAVHPPDGFHAARNPNVVSPPRSMASPPNVSAATPPPPKSIPPPPRANSYTAANPAFTQSPPKADPYAPKQANPVPPPPAAASSIPLSDPYATTAPPAHAISTLAPPSSANIVDLSHSPPTQRQPISKYNPQKYAHNTNGGPNAFGSANSNPPVRAGSFGGTLPPPPPLPPTTLVSDSDAFGKAQYIAAPSQAAPTNYAPSPSLLGTNDPLGRAAVRVPIFSFGFGGRVVACFHNNPGMGAFDGMAPAKPSTSLTVKLLKDVIAPSAYDVTDGGFPGPLFNDQGPGGATSVLQTAGAALKAKKTALIQWLEGRIAEIEGGLMYIGTTGPIGGGTAKAEGKVVLMKLLKIWVENDGKLSGSPAIEEAIRTALLGSRSDVSSSVGETSALGYQYALGNGPTSFYTGDGQGMSKPDAVTATYQTKTSSLDKIQEHLLHGERKKAYQLALDERLWAHALLIARGLDEESWTEAAHEFIKIELSSQGVGYDPQQPFSSDGRESLRVAYGLFAGDGPSA